MTLVLRRLEEPPADTNGLTAYRPRNCLFPNRGLAFPFRVNFSPEFNLKSSNIGATNLFLDVHDLKIIWFLCRSQSSPAMLAMWGVSATTGWSRQQRCRLPKAALVVKKRPVSFLPMCGVREPPRVPARPWLGGDSYPLLRPTPLFRILPWLAVLIFESSFVFFVFGKSVIIPRRPFVAFL